MKKMMMMAILILATLTVNAQNRVGTTTIQPKVGLSLANVTGDFDSDFRVGLVAGAEFEYGASHMLGLSVGALYSMQGAKEDGTTAKLDYINIPILANVYVSRGLAVKMGLQPGFNVSARASAKVEGVTVEGDIDGIKTVDLSLPIGISYERNRWVFDARYNWGLTKVFDEGSAKNSVFQFTLGYKFRL